MKLKISILMASALSIGVGTISNTAFAMEPQSSSKASVIFHSKALNKAAEAMLAVQKDLIKLNKPLKVDYISYVYFENGEVHARNSKFWRENFTKMISCTINIENRNNALPSDYKITKSIPKGSLVTAHNDPYGLASLTWGRSEIYASAKSDGAHLGSGKRKTPSASVNCESYQGVSPEIWKKMITLSQEAANVYEYSSAQIPRQFVIQADRGIIDNIVYMFDTEAQRPIAYHDNPADSE